jgi:hypothetical protein
VDGSGSFPTWIERVANPACFFIMIPYGLCQIGLQPEKQRLRSLWSIP